jgi:hypothetical protein
MVLALLEAASQMPREAFELWLSAGSVTPQEEWTRVRYNILGWDAMPHAPNKVQEGRNDKFEIILLHAH